MSTPDNHRIGRFLVSTVGGETVRAYIPPALPPIPPVRLDSVQRLLEQANQALGRLDGLASFLPDLSLFIYAYVRKEALLSSQIEGTQSSLSDLLLFENQEVPGVPIEDVQDVSNYVAALSHGLKRIREGFPLSLRLIREIHEILLSRGRGSNKEPGEFRRSQNWIGGTRPGNAAFVPPPPELVMECMGQFESFIAEAEARICHCLSRAALGAYVQFESIHPFLDGNGRLGRLLITFLLCADGALSEPILYLSLYFKSNRPVYYDLLTSVLHFRATGEAWIEFFLTGVKETSERGDPPALVDLYRVLDHDRKKIEALGRPAASVSCEYFRHLRPDPSDPLHRSCCGRKRSNRLSRGTVAAAIHRAPAAPRHSGMRSLAKQRRKLFAYTAVYMDILNEGTEPLR